MLRNFNNLTQPSTQNQTQSHQKTGIARLWAFKRLTRVKLDTKSCYSGRMTRHARYLSLLAVSLPLIACGTAQRSVATERAYAAQTQQPAEHAQRSVAPAIALASPEVFNAHAAAMQRAVGWQTLQDEALTAREILREDRAPTGSHSAGTVADGVLLNAAELPFAGDHHAIIERHRKNQTRWGTEQLVALIQAAADHVGTKAPGAPLRVGNMSRKAGGDIRWSRSHNSGRDADLAFYVVDAKSGESVPAPDLLRFDEHGVPAGRGDLRFDVARNWLLVEGFLNQTDINVQWLFISLPLKQMLLDEAARVGADPEVIRRAESVLHQPTDALPHADHFHLRIGCSRDNRLDGCLDYGPQWDWYDWHRDALLARSIRVAEVFVDGTVAERKRALEFLAMINSPFAADVAGVWGFWDDDPEVRKLAISTASGQHGWTANALVQVQRLAVASTAGSSEQRTAYSIMRRSRDPESRDFAVRRLADTTLAPKERALAASALGHFMELPLVPLLLQSLDDEHPSVRQAAADILRRITNHTEGVDWATAPATERAQGKQRWEAFWSERAGAPREALLAEGFRAAGVDVDTVVTTQHIDALMPLLRAEHPHLRYNANRTIRELTGRWAPLDQLDGRALDKFWSGWWKKNRERVIVGDLGS